MTAELVFPDPRTIVIARLLERLPAHGWPAVEVRSRVPKHRPAQLVTVAAGGGQQLNLVADDPLVIVECWAQTDTDANDLARTCRSIVSAMQRTEQAGTAIYRVQIAASPVELPDTSGIPRWTFTASVAMRGSAPA